MAEPVAEFMRYSAPDAEAHARGINELREQLQHALLVGDNLATIDHAADLASMLTTDRKESEALHLLQQHIAAAESSPSEEPAGWFWNAYATALQYTGRRTEADVCFAKALSLCHASGWSRLQALVLHHWGRNLVEQRRFAEGEARISEALAIRVRINDKRQESSRHALEVLAELRGRHEQRAV